MADRLNFVEQEDGFERAKVMAPVMVPRELFDWLAQQTNWTSTATTRWIREHAVELADPHTALVVSKDGGQYEPIVLEYERDTGESLIGAYDYVYEGPRVS